MDGSTVWKIGWNTKWGQDVILVRQDGKPTKKQLTKMYKSMLKEYVDDWNNDPNTTEKYSYDDYRVIYTDENNNIWVVFKTFN